ncbi:MAG TPA: class I SAM-dependent methyltransferase [Anaerolineae bacterium]|nr:class I SAM-dependent methyltransferase [Anaerolineae bacterium]
MDAWLYHGHHQTYTEDLIFWEEIALKKGGPILELGCGTGRVSLHLLKKGYRVIGLDNDFNMLTALKQLAKEEKTSQLYILQADITQFYLCDHFPLIIFPCNTYSTLKPIERKITLERINKQLTQDGWLVISMMNPTLLNHLPQVGEPELDTLFNHPIDGYPVQVTSSWNRHDNNVFILNWTYDHLFPDGTSKRTQIITTHYLAAPECYLDDFRNSGYEIVNCLGDFGNHAYSDQSPYLIIIAKHKPKRKSNEYKNKSR